MHCWKGRLILMKINPFNQKAQDYDCWYDENGAMMKSEIAAVSYLFEKAKEQYRAGTGKNDVHGLEVGVGSGRFSVALGIEIGIDPAPNMLEIASKRGVKVVQGIGEALPFIEQEFDFTAFFTSICFMDDPQKAFQEAYRVTKENGFLICSFLNRDSAMGKQLDACHKEEFYYQNAVFYSGDEIMEFLAKAGYGNFETRETVFTPSAELQPHHEGLGSGLYGVILAWKKKSRNE